MKHVKSLGVYVRMRLGHNQGRQLDGMPFPFDSEAVLLYTQGLQSIFIVRLQMLYKESLLPALLIIFGCTTGKHQLNSIENTSET